MKKVIFLVMIFLLSINLDCKNKVKDFSKDEKVQKILNLALLEFDRKNYDSAIYHFDRILKIYPNNLEVKYEKGLAHYLKGEYSISAKIMDELNKSNFNNPQSYLILGNSLDALSLVDSAYAVYEEGITKFSSYGPLYYELGNSMVGRKSMSQASSLWEAGVQNDPSYPHNYYQLAKYYSKLTEKLWAILYGELFMMISDNANRSREISKLIYNTYKDALFYKKVDDTLTQVKFTSINYIINKDSAKRDLPFAVEFQNAMKLAFDNSKILDIEDFNIENLIEIRKEFIEFWYLNKLNLKFPNIIFEKHKKMIDDGVFNAYNYWLLKEGDSPSFNKWISKPENRREYVKFNDWFVDNPEKLSLSHFFTRFMYDYMISNLEFKNK